VKSGASGSSMTSPRRVYVGLTEAQRRRLKRNWIGLIVMWCIGASLVPLVQWLSGANRVDLTLVLAISVPVLLALLILPARWLAQRRRHEALAAAGVICEKCAYPMQGLDSSVQRCPECGQPRQHLQSNRKGHAPRAAPTPSKFRA
jgi:hypothetical protein